MSSKTGKMVLATVLGLGGLTTGLVVAPAIAAAATQENTAAAAVGDRLSKIKGALSGLVSDGTITQAQADRVATTLDERLPQRRPGSGPHGHRGLGGSRSLASAAATLGSSVEELRTALRSGQSLADVAQSKGVSRDTLVGALVDAAKKHLAEDVGTGRLTQAQADARAADLTARVTQQVDRKGLPGKQKRNRAPAPQGPVQPPMRPSSG